VRGSRGRHRVRVWALMAVASVLAAGCLPTPATTEGRDISTLYSALLVIAAIVAAIVVIPTTIAIIRFRRRGDDDDGTLPSQRHGSTKLELTWTAIPVLLVLGIFAATVVVLSRIDPQLPNPGAELRVTAFRWGWTFEYPKEGIRVTGISPNAPEVVVPVGLPIQVTITASDVDHSFFVPQFLFKRDAIPGLESVFRFTVDQPGAYGGSCAEFCGIYHYAMPFTVRAVPPAEYTAWLTTARTSPAASAPAAASGAPAGSGATSASSEPSPASSAPAASAAVSAAPASAAPPEAAGSAGPSVAPPSPGGS
jgi:cytochrome c oxidase subunit II